MATTKIAFRNLSRQKRRTLLLAGAIAFGIFIITAVNGLVGGLLRNTQNNFSVMIAAHILVTEIKFTDKNRMVMDLDETAGLETAVETLGRTYPVKYFQARTSIFNGATIMSQNESVMLQIDGVDWAHDQFLAENLEIVGGDLKTMTGSSGIVLGSKTAKKLNVEVGETVLVQAETVHGQQNVLEVPVKAIFKEDNLSAGTVYMDKTAVNGLMDMPAEASNWYGVFLKNFDDQDAATLELNRLLAAQGKVMYPRDKTVGKSFNTIFGDLRKDKDKAKKRAGQYVTAALNDSLASMVGIFTMIRFVSLAVLVILLLVIMVGLNNTYRIIVWERNREIGTMRAMGMQRGQVSGLFLLEALFLALSGVVAGVVLATVVLTGLSLIPFGGTGDFAIFLSKGHLSWDYDWGQIVLTVGLVSGLSLLSALFPARRAGKVDPAVALRTTA